MRNLPHRSMASQALSITQGNKLHLDFSKFDTCNVDVISGWQDHCQLSYNDHQYKLETIESLENATCFIVGESQTMAELNSRIVISVPEYLDVIIDANSIDLHMIGKVSCAIYLLWVVNTLLAF